MRKCERLKKITWEHLQTLEMAKNIGVWSNLTDTSELQFAIDHVRLFFKTDLNTHFQHEEDTIFAILMNHFDEYTDIVFTLRHEHEVIRRLIYELSVESAPENLARLAVILIDHTQIEERHLFPLVENLFSKDQLDLVVGKYNHLHAAAIVA